MEEVGLQGRRNNYNWNPEGEIRPHTVHHTAVLGLWEYHSPVWSSGALTSLSGPLRRFGVSAVSMSEHQ